ncbi:uncharacterized protein LOC106666111 [Cimex lectularius]|uniref:Biogenesis of lysosome-related organelles complex 1 subunit 3 n=1 Tax=Cimex lectularius TaxID=79782 RepID=A0A8I6RN75_CIMLE|nr:uncharacterized protein LOC106666111 [Cimex lectularius]
MENDKSSVVVEGEASESDEEDFMRPVGKSLENARRYEVHSSEDELSIAVRAFVSKAEEMNEANKAKYNTLLHKKLKESHFRLKEDLKSFVASSLKYASDQMNEINQSLLSAQVETQESIGFRRRSAATLLKTDQALTAILSYKLC